MVAEKIAIELPHFVTILYNLRGYDVLTFNSERCAVRNWWTPCAGGSLGGLIKPLIVSYCNGHQHAGYDTCEGMGTVGW